MPQTVTGSNNNILITGALAPQDGETYEAIDVSSPVVDLLNNDIYLSSSFFNFSGSAATDINDLQAGSGSAATEINDLQTVQAQISSSITSLQFRELRKLSQLAEYQAGVGASFVPADFTYTYASGSGNQITGDAVDNGLTASVAGYYDISADFCVSSFAANDYCFNFQLGTKNIFADEVLSLYVTSSISMRGFEYLDAGESLGLRVKVSGSAGSQSIIWNRASLRMHKLNY